MDVSTPRKNMGRQEYNGGVMQTLALLYMGAGIVNTITGMVKKLDKDTRVGAKQKPSPRCLPQDTVGMVLIDNHGNG